MALTTTNMGLKEWDLIGDNFSHGDLLANWNAIDIHDHTTGKGVQIPTAGIANLAVTGSKIAASAIDSSKVQDGTLTDADLASPNNSAYRTIAQFAASANPGIADSGTFFLLAGALDATNGALYGNGVNLSGSTHVGPALVPLTAADYSVAGKTTQLRIRVAWINNNAASNLVFTFGLYPISSITAASGSITLALGTVLAGSTIAVTPLAAQSGQSAGTDFAFPSNGVYVPGVVISGAGGAAQHWTTFEYYLQTHHT